MESGVECGLWLQSLGLFHTPASSWCIETPDSVSL